MAAPVSASEASTVPLLVPSVRQAAAGIELTTATIGPAETLPRDRPTAGRGRSDEGDLNDSE